MIEHDLDDGLLRRLSTLPTIAQDRRRRELTRVRYQAALARRRRAVDRRASTRRLLEPILVGGFSLIFVIAMVYDVLQWR